MNWRAGLQMAILSGVIAAIVSTLIQVLLWLTFTESFPAILFRDAHLTAALVLGSSVLPPPASFDIEVILVSTAIHFMLSITYAMLLALIMIRCAEIPAWISGTLFGAVLYAVNLYGFTQLFPWFEQTRGWITFAAHLAFGLSAALSGRILLASSALTRDQSGDVQS